METSPFENCGRLDLYEGRIAIFAERYYWTSDWRWAFLAPGYVTLGYWFRPNHHLGLIPMEIALDPAKLVQVRPHDPLTSPYLRIGAMLTAQEQSSVHHIRFGRTQTLDAIGPNFMRINIGPLIFENLDDSRSAEVVPLREAS